MRWYRESKIKRKNEIRVLLKFAWLPVFNVIGDGGNKCTIWLERYERIEQWHVPDIMIPFAPEPYWTFVQCQVITQ